MRTRGLVWGLASIFLLGCQTGRSWEEPSGVGDNLHPLLEQGRAEPLEIIRRVVVLTNRSKRVLAIGRTLRRAAHAVIERDQGKAISPMGGATWDWR